MRRREAAQMRNHSKQSKAHMKNYDRAICIGQTLVLGLMAGAAHAQTAPSPGGFDEIVVTAQKRSESVQTVPISMTALGGSKLERIGAQEMVDFARDVPGLTVVSN